MVANTEEMINQFLLWEKASQDTIDFKMCYVDMADDLVSGLLLSQIIYWYLPSKNRSEAETKLRVKRDGVLWIAKGRTEWYDEIRLSPKQFDRASNLLVSLGLIEKKVMKFGEETKVHVRLLWNNFLKRLHEVVMTENMIESLEDMGFDQRENQDLPSKNGDLPKGEIGNSPKVKSGIDQKAIPTYTEITTESTTKSSSKKQKKKSLTTTTIDFENGNLQEAYPNIFIEEISKDLLNDNRYVINTRLQYRALMELKIEDQLKSVNTKKSIRKEMLPDWFTEENQQQEQPKEVNMDIADAETKKKNIEDMLKRLRE
jgi:hypothetical protein